MYFRIVVSNYGPYLLEELIDNSDRSYNVHVGDYLSLEFGKSRYFGDLDATDKIWSIFDFIDGNDKYNTWIRLNSKNHRFEG